MKKIVLTLTTAIVFAWQGLSFAGSSVDALIQKLEDKGILTKQEANQVKGEIADKEESSQKSTFKSMLPEWVSGLKVGGDFRLRDQVEKTHKNGSTNYVRNRGRLRARLNFEDQINDKVKLIFGIATDGGSSRSNNYTFGGNGNNFGISNTTAGSDDFGKPGVVLNKAYAIYKPASWATLMGGKMDNPVWEPDTFLWDDDFTPEGGSVQLQKKINDYITPFVQQDFFVLHDASPSATSIRTDPYIMVTQGGIKGNLTDKVYYKTAGSYYHVNNPAHIRLNNNSGTNTTEGLIDGTTGLYYNFDALVAAAELGINDPFGDYLPSPIYIPQIGVFGQFEQNPNPSHQRNAWMMGGYMGNSSINGWKTWRLTNYYRVVERDAWLDSFTEDDFYSGDTSTAGWHTTLEYGLMKNVSLKLTWYHTHIYKVFPTVAALAQKAPQDILQMDINFKF